MRGPDSQRLGTPGNFKTGARAETTDDHVVRNIIVFDSRQREARRANLFPWRGMAVAVALSCAFVSARAPDVSDVLPEIRTLPAPPSIRPGLRLSFYSSLANVPKSAKYSWLDNKGVWHSEWMPGPSGHGYTQVDVVSVTPETAALNVQGWQYYNFTGPLLPISGGQAALLSYPGGGDWWVHPQILAKIQETTQPGLIILRMPERVGDRTYNVIRVQTEDAQARQALSYDLETGYLVYKGGMVEGADAVTLSQAAFTGARQVPVPWAGGALPGWIQRTQQLRYEGNVTIVTWGSNPLNLPMSASLDHFVRGVNFLVYDQTVTMASFPGMPPTVEKATLVAGVDHFAGLFLPVSAFPSLRAGQQIDRDDVTGATVSVGFVGPLDNGRAGAVFRITIGNAYWAETAFDAASGVAVRLRIYAAPSPLYSTQSEMRLVELPEVTPSAPRLAVLFDAAAGILRVSCSADPGTSVTLLRSSDVARDWVPVPGFEDRPSVGGPLTFELPVAEGPAFFRVRVRL